MLLFERHGMMKWKCFVNIYSDDLSVWPHRPVVSVFPHVVLRFSTALPELTTAGRRQLCLCFCLLNSPPLSGFQIVNITMAALQNQEQQAGRRPVDITFTVRGSRGYLVGSEVSNALMKLTVVEFSYYLGFPVLQIAERECDIKKRH